MARLFTTLVLLVLGFYTLYSMRSSRKLADQVVEHDAVERTQVPVTQADDDSMIARPSDRQLLVKNDKERDLRSQSAFDETQILSNYRAWFESLAAANSELERRRLQRKGHTILSERRRLLAHLITTNPRRAIEHRVSLSERALIPKKLQPILENDIAKKGRFIRVCNLLATHAPGAAYTDQFYVEYDGTAYETFVYGDRTHQLTHETNNLDGIEVDQKVALKEGSYPAGVSEVTLLSGINGDDLQLGQKEKVYVIRVATFEDPDPEAVFSATADADHQTLLAVGEWNKKNSYGRIDGFDVSYAPIIALEKPVRDYDGGGEKNVTKAADEILKRQGVTIPNARLIIYHLSEGLGGSPGKAVLGGKVSWVSRLSWKFRPLAHELGHNYGIEHARLIRVKSLDSDFENPTQFVEYGSFHDIMGGSMSSTAAHRATSKQQLNWLPRSVNKLLTKEEVDRGVTVKLSPYNDATFHETDPLTVQFYGDSGRLYNIELSSLYGPIIYYQKPRMNYSGRPVYEDWINIDIASYPVDTNNWIVLDAKNKQKINKYVRGDGLFLKVSDETIDAASSAYQNMSIYIARTDKSDNHKPVVGLSANKTRVFSGDPVQFAAKASDPDGDTLTYEWSFSTGAQVYDFATDQLQVEQTWNLKVPTEIWAQVKVTDNAGLSVTKKLALSLVTTDSPENETIATPPIETTNVETQSTDANQKSLNPDVTQGGHTQNEDDSENAPAKQAIQLTTLLDDPSKLVFWFSSESMLQTDDQSRVVRWFDHDRRWNELFNYITTERPLVRGEGQSKGVVFDGIDDHLAASFIYPLKNAQQQTYIFSIKTADEVATRQTIYYDERSDVIFRVYIEDGAIVFELKQGKKAALLKHSIAVQNRYAIIVAIDFEGSHFSAWVNDVKVGEETIGFSIADKTARSILLGKGYE